jgi:two-component system, LytTR family, sensor kinase
MMSFIKPCGQKNRIWLTLYVENNYTALSQNTEGGIGLENVKRRLNILYPNELHTLNYDSDGRFFKVNLTLKLQ